MKHPIKENSIIYTVKDSKFLAFLIPLNNKEEVNDKLKWLKEEYKDATHYTYAYIINGQEKMSDDHEPKGTAGVPILSILKHNNLDYCLGVVIRYFGGTKLGASNLLRAYMESMKKCVDTASLKDIEYGYLMRITFDYSNLKIINNLLIHENIKYKEYDNLITYEFMTTNMNIQDELKKDVHTIEVIDKVII